MSDTSSSPGRRTRSRFATAGVTWSIMVACILVFLAQQVSGGVNGELSLRLIFYPQLITVEPWTVVTSLFAHASLLHILFNMYSLYALGPSLEQALGHWRFAVLYFLSGIGGSVGVLLLNSGPVLGASGAIFGLLGAYFVIERRMGGNITQLLVVIALNLGIGFIVPGIAWQAHIGGLLVGALVAVIYLRPRTRTAPHLQAQLLWATAAGILAIALVKIVLF